MERIRSWITQENIECLLSAISLAAGLAALPENPNYIVPALLAVNATAHVVSKNTERKVEVIEKVDDASVSVTESLTLSEGELSDSEEEEDNLFDMKFIQKIPSSRTFESFCPKKKTSKNKKVTNIPPIRKATDALNLPKLTEDLSISSSSKNTEPAATVSAIDAAMSRILSSDYVQKLPSSIVISCRSITGKNVPDDSSFEDCMNRIQCYHERVEKERLRKLEEQKELERKEAERRQAERTDAEKEFAKQIRIYNLFKKGVFF